MAFVNIRNTNLSQKRERKQRLLNEIMEWALDLNKCYMTESTKQDLLNTYSVHGKENWKRYWVATIADQRNVSLQRKNMTKYIQGISSVLGSTQLVQSVKLASNCLESHISSTKEWLDKVQEANADIVPLSRAFIGGAKKPFETLEDLRNHLSEVLKEVARIKALELD